MDLFEGKQLTMNPLTTFLNDTNVCPKCGNKGFTPSTRYFGVLEMCNCAAAAELKNKDGSITLDIRETPSWFQSAYHLFTAPFTDLED